MKKKVLIILSIIITSSLCFQACYAAPNEALVEISCDEFMEHNTIYKKTMVAAGGLLVVGLCPGTATGFEWEWSASDHDIINEVDYHYEPTRDNINDAAGIDVWTYKAAKRGNTTIVMEQVRKGAQEEKGPWRLDINVLVR